jgi:O-antigen/teichoic acid export membrane protein
MMRTALSRLFKGSIVYGIGAISQRFIGIFLLPFYTQALKPADYGAMALISLVGVAMSGVLSLGTGNSMGVLYFKEQDRSKRPAILWTNFSLLLANGLFWYVLIFLFAPQLSLFIFQTVDYTEFIRLAFIGTVLGNFSEVWLAYLRMEEKAKSYVVLTLGITLITIGLSVGLILGLSLGLYGLILSTVFGQVFLLLAVLLFIARKLPFQIDVEKVWPLIRIGSPSIFGLFAFLLIDYADRQMIERILDLTALGLYTIGYSFGMVVTMAVGAFSSAWPPFFMSYINKREEAKVIFGKVLTYYVFAFGVLTVVFFGFAKPVVLVLTAPDFRQAWTVIGLVAASHVLKGCYLIMLPGLNFAEKLSKQSLIEWIAAIINLLANLWLIPIFGIRGAALATFISYLSLPLFTWLLARKYLEVDYQMGRVAFAFALSGFFAAVLYQLSNWSDFELLGLLGANGLVMLVFFVLVYTLLLDQGERVVIRNILKR